VSPVEVEAAMQEVPGLEECAAAEVEVRPDVRVIGLFYTAAEPLPETLLKAHAERRLARYKRPRLYRRVETLPRGNNGKLLRKALRGLGG